MIRKIRLRKECPEIGSGDWRPVRTNRPEILAVLYEWRNPPLVRGRPLNLAPQSGR
jgi:maltose alpha-D-glucosyltransferase/alpha-amylase